MRSGAVTYVKRHYLLWLVLLFVVVLLGAYAAGYRPGPGLTLVRVGTLTVTDIPPGTNLYVDQALRGTAKGTSLSAPLVPGNHTVIVDAQNDQPWEHIVTIPSNKAISISPILVPKKPLVSKLSSTESAAAVKIVAATKLPTEAQPLQMGCVLVSVSNNRVIGSPATSTPGCATPPDYLCSDSSCEPTILYAPAAAIHSVIPVPGRTDALVIATGEWTYAIGLDPRYPQFFAPVVHGHAPKVGVLTAPLPDLGGTASTSFYLSDSGNNYLVTF